MQTKLRRKSQSMNNLKNNHFFEHIPSFLQPLFTKCDFPWHIIPSIKGYISEILESGLPGYKILKEGVLVGMGADVHKNAVIEGPSIIGENAVIRPGAYIRGSAIISPGCVIGNSTEIKNSILLESVQAPHYNYIGDSIIGSFSHLGAGVICSNLKADKTNVTIHGAYDVDTGLRKLGAIVADRVEIGCGCILNPGTVIQKNSSVYPLLSLRGVYPENSIIKSLSEVVPKKQNRD